MPVNMQRRPVERQIADGRCSTSSTAAGTSATPSPGSSWASRRTARTSSSTRRAASARGSGSSGRTRRARGGDSSRASTGSRPNLMIVQVGRPAPARRRRAASSRTWGRRSRPRPGWPMRVQRRARDHPSRRRPLHLRRDDEHGALTRGEGDVSRGLAEQGLGDRRLERSSGGRTPATRTPGRRRRTSTTSRRSTTLPCTAIGVGQGMDVTGRPGPYVFKRRSVYRINSAATGAYTTLSSEAGAGGSNCVADIAGMTAFIGDAGIYVTRRGRAPGEGVGQDPPAVLAAFAVASPTADLALWSAGVKDGDTSSSTSCAPAPPPRI